MEFTDSVVIISHVIAGQEFGKLDIFMSIVDNNQMETIQISVFGVGAIEET